MGRGSLLDRSVTHRIRVHSTRDTSEKGQVPDLIRPQGAFKKHYTHAGDDFEHIKSVTGPKISRVLLVVLVSVSRTHPLARQET